MLGAWHAYNAIPPFDLHLHKSHLPLSHGQGTIEKIVYYNSTMQKKDTSENVYQQLDSP